MRGQRNQQLSPLREHRLHSQDHAKSGRRSGSAHARSGAMRRTLRRSQQKSGTDDRDGSAAVFGRCPVTSALLSLATTSRTSREVSSGPGGYIHANRHASPLAFSAHHFLATAWEASIGSDEWKSRQLSVLSSTWSSRRQRDRLILPC
jgi:hypothetical protein